MRGCATLRAMGRYHELLDQIIAGTAGEKPPHVEALDLPGIQGWDETRVWGDWTVNPVMYHGQGAVFGGYLAALADAFASLAMMTVLDDNENFTTADLRLNFFRPVVSGVLHCEASVVNRGRRMAHVEVVFTRDDDKVAGKATATQVIQTLDS